MTNCICKVRGRPWETDGTSTNELLTCAFHFFYFPSLSFAPRYLSLPSPSIHKAIRRTVKWRFGETLSCIMHGFGGRWLHISLSLLEDPLYQPNPTASVQAKCFLWPSWKAWLRFPNVEGTFYYYHYSTCRWWWRQIFLFCSSQMFEALIP